MDGKKFTMIELKKAGGAVADYFGVDLVTGCKLLGFYNAGSHKDEKIVADIVAGDFSAVPAAAAALGVKILGGSNKKNPSHEKKTEKKKVPADDRKEPKKRSFQEPTEGGAGQQDDRETDGAAGDSIEKISGEVVPVGAVVPSLPASLPDDVENWLSDFSKRYDIDLVKASGQQWRSACIYVGQHIQKSGVLLDHERLRREGGSKIYNPHAVAALLGLWEYVTGIYKHVPLASDFIAFSGVSREWFYDSKGELTSSRLDIAQKARAIEESGLSAGLVDGRENPTGRIYYSKARLGWRESVEIVHTSNNNAAAAPALPVFDVSSGLISENVDKIAD